MIDHDLSDQLHSLAATVDEPFDLSALHRRISAHSRRRAVARVGFAGAGLAAVVAGLFVVRPGPAGSGLSAASPTSSQDEPTAPPDCSVVLAGLRAEAAKPDAAAKEVPTDRSDSAGDEASRGFKGVVTILTIDGPRLTFRDDEPKVTPPTTGAATVDAATVWVDGATQLDAPPTLQVGEQLGLAARPASDGVDHVVFIDVGVAAAASDPAEASDPNVVVAGKIPPPGPTAKSHATIAAVDATSITVTLDDNAAPTKTAAIDIANTVFYAGDTVCAPGLLTVGTALGVAYHLGDTGDVIADAVMLMP
jgi:hypothetical protein